MIEMSILKEPSKMLLNTPWGVWLIFAYLLSKGFAMLEKRVIDIRKILILPVLFLVFSIHALKNVLAPVTSYDLLCWVFAIVIGATAGWAHSTNLKIQASERDLKVTIPGSRIPLYIFTFLFCANYFFYYKISSDILVVHRTWYRVALLGILGCSTGFFLGRFKYCARVINKVRLSS